MLERVSRQPEIAFDARQSAHHVQHLAAWRPVVDAVARGEQVGLAQIDRAILSAFSANRDLNESDAAACARLMRQDRDIRVLLSERGALVGKPVDLPPFEIVPVEPIPPAEKLGMNAERAAALGELRRYVYGSRAPGENYERAKARLIASGDAEFARLSAFGDPGETEEIEQ